VCAHMRARATWGMGSAFLSLTEVSNKAMEGITDVQEEPFKI
jgi:hypothetical protein